MKRNEWILAAVALLVLFISTYIDMKQPAERDDIIRLHVIANSDTPEDQALKLHIRDHLLLSFGDIFREAESIEEARDIIRANLADLEKAASMEVKKQGYSYQVDAQLGIYPFPTRVYGDIVYPAGNYESLRVVIGEGKGANWWCVMFPPLCFVDVSSGVARQPDEKPAKAEEKAGAVQEAVVTEYSFKLAELWQSFRIWICSLFA